MKQWGRFLSVTDITPASLLLHVERSFFTKINAFGGSSLLFDEDTVLFPSQLTL